MSTMRKTFFLKNALIAILFYMVVKLLVQSAFLLIYIFFYPTINQVTYANVSYTDAIILTCLDIIQVMLVPVLMWKLFVVQIHVFNTKPARNILVYMSLLLSMLFFIHFVIVMKMR